MRANSLTGRMVLKVPGFVVTKLYEDRTLQELQQCDPPWHFFGSQAFLRCDSRLPAMAFQEDAQFWARVWYLHFRPHLQPRHHLTDEEFHIWDVSTYRREPTRVTTSKRNHNQGAAISNLFSGLHRQLAERLAHQLGSRRYQHLGLPPTSPYILMHRGPRHPKQQQRSQEGDAEDQNAKKKASRQRHGSHFQVPPGYK